MLKRLISFSIVLSLVLSVNTVFASDDKYYSSVYEAVEFLQDLNMLNKDYDEATIVPDSLMTNADMANYVADVFLNGQKSENVYFHDVPAQHWAFEKVSVLVEAGILTQGENKMFYPEKIANKDDLTKIIVSLLGYKPGVNDNQEGFVNTYAKKVKLLENTKGGTDLTFGNMVIMLYNGLMSETLTVSSISQGEIGYKNSGKTFLEERYSLYVYRGYLEGYNSVSTSTKEVRDNHAVIDGEEYLSQIDLSEYIGYKIKYIYRQGKKSEEKVIISAKIENPEDSLTLYYYENDISFDKDTYTLEYYLDNGNKVKKAKLSEGISVIYNGEFVGEGINEILSNRFYSVLLIRKPSESAYSTAVISAYDNYIVRGFNSEEQGFYDKTTGSYVNLSSADNVLILSDDGTELKYEDLNNDDILSVYKSANGKKIKIVRSTKSVQGYISRVENKNGYKVITVDNSKYPSEKKITKDTEVKLDYAKIRIDEHGFYIDIEYIPESLKKGYLIDMAYDNRKIDGEVNFKILTESGDVAYFKAADKIKIDGDTYKNREDIYEALGKANCASQIIAYKLKSDEFINYIDTVKVGANETADSLHINMQPDDYAYRSSPGRLGNKMYLNDSTKIFIIPGNPKQADVKKFYVKSRYDILGDRAYYCSSYSTKEKTEFEEIVLFENYEWTGNEDFNSAGVLVTGINDVLNSEGVCVKGIEGYKGTNKVELICDEDCDITDLGVGDFITYNTSRNNEVSSISIWYSAASSDTPYAQDIYAEIAVTSGYANSVSGTLVKFGKYSGADFDDLYNFNGTPIIIYDADDEKVWTGNVNDIIPYDVSSSKPSFAVIQFHYSNPLVCIIYK